MKSLTVQLKLMLKRKSFILALAIGIFFAVAVFFYYCITFFGEALFQVKAAKYLYLGSDLIDSVLFEIYAAVFPILAALPFSDTFFEEREQRTTEFCITRQTNNAYYFSKMTAVFISGFLVAVIPLLINMGLNYITFPVDSMIDSTNFSKIESGVYRSVLDTVLFPDLFVKNTYLYNLIYLILTSITSGLFAVIVYQFSFFYSKSKSILLISFFAVYNIIMMLLNVFGLSEFCIKNYMFSARFFTNMTERGFAVTYILLILGCILPIPLAKKRLNDNYV